MTRSWGLRSELVISASLLVGAALLFVALLLLRLTETRLLEQRVTLLSRQAQSLPALLDGQAPSRLAALIKNYAATNQLAAWQLRDHREQILGQSAPPPNIEAALKIRQTLLWQQQAVQLHYPPFWQTALARQPAPRYLDISLAIAAAGATTLVLHLRHDLNDISRQLAELYRLALACCLGYGLVLVGAAVFILNRTVVQPLTQLTVGTLKISQGDLKQRLDLAGPREISTLGASFNRMAESLEQHAEQQQQQLHALQTTNQQLLSTRQQLAHSERMASVGNLTSGMAHELGNPLSAVIGYLELLKRSVTQPLSRDYLQRAMQESERMDQLLKDLLDFAAPDTATAAADCDPAAVVRQCWLIMEQQGVFKQHRASNQVPDALPRVTIAAHKLQQILVNLLLNARDATPADGTITLSAHSERDHQQLQLSVTDSGHGLSVAQQQAIFDPFFTTKAPGCGRGLGLYVCYQLVHDCGGQLQVRSRPHHGSCFTVTLPVTAVTGVTGVTTDEPC